MEDFYVGDLSFISMLSVLIMAATVILLIAYKFGVRTLVSFTLIVISGVVLFNREMMIVNKRIKTELF